MKPIINVALDLETLSRQPNAAIISIAASLFDKYDEPLAVDYPTFSASVDATTCAFAGMHFDEDTVNFWANQSDEAKAAILDNETLSIRAALESFINWLEFIKQPNPEAEIVVWTQGTDFDIPKIEWALQHVLGMKEMPWKYCNKRDARTYILEGIESKCGYLEKPYSVLPSMEGYIPHSAMSDVKRMIFNIQNITQISFADVEPQTE